MGSFFSNVGLALTDFASRNKVLYVAAEPLADALVWAKVSRVRLHSRSYRVTSVVRALPGRGRELDWRRRRPNYYHERRAVIGVLIAGLLVHALSSIDTFFYFEWYWIAAVPWYPPALLPTVVLILAVQRFFAGRLRGPDVSPAGPGELPLGRFCAIWLACFTLAASGIPTLGYFGFALWLGL